MDRVARGVYRIFRFPAVQCADLWTAGPLAEGQRLFSAGILSGETALLLHGGTDVNPSLIHVTLPKRSRIERTPPAPHKASLR